MSTNPYYFVSKGSITMTKLRLMSHNQWKCDHNLPDWEKIGADCSAEVRVRGFVRVYKDTLPDVIGCQEVSATMADYLVRFAAEEGLHYALLWGRDTPILYRPDKFELVDSAFALYPDEFPGHEGIFNNDQTKSWNLAVFRVKESGKLFIFVSTHLWWKSGNPAAKNYQPYSAEARAYQIGLVSEKIKEYQAKYACPAVLVGDLNSGYGSLAIDRAFREGFRHAHDLATDYADESCGLHECFGWGYYNYYNDAPFPASIDHILIKDAPEGFVRRYERFSPEYYLPLSDHSPAIADVEF